MLPKQNNYSVGIYMRLSKDDERAGESLSIENQRAILTEYVSKQGWTIYDEYVDDGISGVPFERPGLQRMLDDAKAGRINLIICKDLSRFGRNYIMVGQYTDYIFPMYGIRFIALNDNVDTANSQSAGMDMMPIMNIFNEWHCANTSQKIKAVFASNAKAGKYKSCIPSYGYVKADDEKHTPIIDPESAAVVKHIFELRAKGIGMQRIAKILNEENVLTPYDYYCKRVGKFNARRSVTHLWGKDAVRRILYNPIYIGTLAQQRYTSVSYKNHKTVFKDEEDWVVIENNHEPIISQELWDKFREYDVSVSRGKSDKNGVVSPFSGLLYCADCGFKMKKTQLKIKGKESDVAFSCGYHMRFGKNYCSTHTIRESVLEALVIADIQSKLQLIVNEKQARDQFLKKKMGLHNAQTATDNKRKREVESRLAELEILIQSVYENMVLGKVSEDLCIGLLDNYRAEKNELETEFDEIQNRLDAFSQDEHDVDEFIRRLKKYARFEVLTREMLFELVEYITIEDAPRTRNAPRTIHIYYKFLDKAPLNKRNILM